MKVPLKYQMVSLHKYLIIVLVMQEDAFYKFTVFPTIYVYYVSTVNFQLAITISVFGWVQYVVPWNG